MEGEKAEARDQIATVGPLTSIAYSPSDTTRTGVLSLPVIINGRNAGTSSVRNGAWIDSANTVE